MKWTEWAHLTDAQRADIRREWGGGLPRYNNERRKWAVVSDVWVWTWI